MNDRQRLLREAIESTHGCKAVHAMSVSVTEMSKGKVVWEGVVELFDLFGHAQAARCYAWPVESEGETRCTTVLELPPVTSARTAVQASLAVHTHPTSS
jgi:hypothetical protein